MAEIDDARASLLAYYSQQTTGQSTNLLTIALIGVTLVGLQLANRSYLLWGLPILVLVFSRSVVRLLYWGSLSNCALWVSPHPSPYYEEFPIIFRLHLGAHTATIRGTEKINGKTVLLYPGQAGDNRIARTRAWFLRFPPYAKLVVYVLFAIMTYVILWRFPP